jgi:hypothetical protein
MLSAASVLVKTKNKNKKEESNRSAATGLLDDSMLDGRCPTAAARPPL